jgi:hypothetical protein
MPTNHDDKEQQAKLIEIVRQTIKHDEALREKYDVKNKFRFVRDRLQALLSHLEKDLQIKVDQEETPVGVTLEPDEVIVYVYLFNAHGVTLKTWQNMLIPQVFYEYSVNRPIYSEKNQINALIRSKANPNQHGYISVAIKAIDIQKPGDTVKIKEGSLSLSRVISFTHNEIDYFVSEKGELIKKG